MSVSHGYFSHRDCFYFQTTVSGTGINEVCLTNRNSLPKKNYFISYQQKLNYSLLLITHQQLEYYQLALNYI